MSYVYHSLTSTTLRPPRDLRRAVADRLDVLDEPWLAHEASGPLDVVGLLAVDLTLLLRRDSRAAAGEPVQHGEEADTNRRRVS